MQYPNRRIRCSQCDAHNAGDYQTRNGDDGSVLDSEILEQIRSRCNAHAGNDESQEGETGQRYQLGRIVEVGNQRCGKEE